MRKGCVLGCSQSPGPVPVPFSRSCSKGRRPRTLQRSGMMEAGEGQPHSRAGRGWAWLRLEAERGWRVPGLGPLLCPSRGLGQLSWCCTGTPGPGDPGEAKQSLPSPFACPICSGEWALYPETDLSPFVLSLPTEQAPCHKEGTLCLPCPQPPSLPQCPARPSCRSQGGRCTSAGSCRRWRSSPGAGRGGRGSLVFPVATGSPEGDWGVGGSSVGQDELRTLGATGLWNYRQATSRAPVPYALLREPGKG